MRTIQYLEGNGIADDFFNIAVSIPDSGPLQVSGNMQLAGQLMQLVAVTSFAPPTAPTTGSIFYNIQADGATGIATLQFSTTSFPVLNNATSRIVYSQTLVPGEVNLSLGGNDSTPDPALGTP